MKTHLLLDIEGTTCPFSFVIEVLFPYAKANLKPFIDSHYNDAPIAKLLAEVNEEWKRDKHPESANLLARCDKQSLTSKESIIKYLGHLMENDMKSTALKDLQGKIWAQGYKNGTLKSTLFNEAHECIHRWKRKGIKLSIYSSGSVEAQKLLYKHTQSGNLEGFFSHWFDTHTGPKKSKDSYTAIAKIMSTEAKNIIFISDNGEECDAAEAAGMRTLFSLRDNNPDQNPKQHQMISNLNEVDIYI